jgi:predicted dehydrogenase
MLSVTHAAVEPQDTLHIFGSTGSIHVPALNEGKVTIRNRDGERVEVHPPHSNFHQPLIDDFARAVQTDRGPLVDGTIGREVAELEARIYRSNRERTFTIH